MKHAATLLLVLSFCMLLQTPVRAMTWLDDFSTEPDPSTRTYQNLTAFPMDSGYWSGLPDRTAFGFASAAYPQAWALYRVRNARQISVGVYSLSGCFVGNSGGVSFLGVFDETPVTPGNGLPQALYSASEKGVYTRAGGSLLRAAAGNAATVFEPTGDTPGDLIGYGINVYTSPNGQNWSRVSLAQTNLSFRAGNPFVWEEYTGTIPASAGYVRVELNDVPYLPRQNGGGFAQKAPGSYNCLASVALSGENLAMGAAEPVVVEPVLPPPGPPVQPSGEENPAASSARAKRSPALQGGGGGGTSAPSGASSTTPSTSPSKFEGVIEAPRAGGSKAKEKRTSGAQKSASAAPPSQAEESPSAPYADDGILYQIGAKNGDDKPFTAGVTVYIIVVTGALVFVVLSSAKTKK